MFIFKKRYFLYRVMLFFQLNKKSINIGFLYKKTQNIKKIKYSPIKKKLNTI